MFVMTEKHFPEHKQDNIESKLYKIVLYNDDINTFDYVIEMLVHYCNHSIMQAEQCALITHYKGKTVIKTGAYKKLEPIASALLENGLSVEIE
jgi:ATP-dependent Clp protease adaptor protein ClpS